MYLKRPEDVLRAVSVLLANELCLEPSIRHAAKVRTYALCKGHCACVYGRTHVYVLLYVRAIEWNVRVVC